MTATLVKQHGATAFSESEEVSSDFPPTLAFETQELIDPRWDKILQTLLTFFDYEDDWDGMGGVAPEPNLVQSAIALAIILRNSSQPAPDGVGPTCDGTITFDTGPLPIECLEVMTPTHAEWWRGGELLGEFQIGKR